MVDTLWTKNLIISWNCYDWLYDFYSKINFNNLDLIVICEYGNTESKNHPELCVNALKEQRKHDLIRLGKKLNIDKIINLDYFTYTKNIEKLKTQLLLNCGITKYSTIYYTNLSIISKILSNLKNIRLISSDENKMFLPDEIKTLMIGE